MNEEGAPIVPVPYAIAWRVPLDLAAFSLMSDS